MTKKILRAQNGMQTNVDSASGPSSYPTGGFSVSTDLGRVDEASVDIDNPLYEARLDSVTSKNSLLVEAYSQASGTELAAGTDLSTDSVTYTAHRL